MQNNGILNFKKNSKRCTLPSAMPFGNWECTKRMEKGNDFFLKKKKTGQRL